MNKFLLAIFIAFTTNSFAQITQADLDKEVKSIDNKIRSLNSENAKLENDIQTLKLKLDAAQQQITNLNSKTESNSSEINTTRNDLGLKISTTESTTNDKITAVDQSVSKSTLYSIIGVLLAVLISGILYFLLSKRQKVDRSDLIEKLSKTKSSLEEGLIKEFGKQTELLETQIKMIEGQKTNSSAPI